MQEKHDFPELESVNDLLTEAIITCPYCWESIDIVIDHSAGDTSYVEDCQVCCQPIMIAINLIGGGHDIQVARENE